jgi:hypothetical protein
MKSVLLVSGDHNFKSLTYMGHSDHAEVGTSSHPRQNLKQVLFMPH